MILAQVQTLEFRVPPVDLLAVGPETALAVAGLIVVVLASFRHRLGGLGALPSVVGFGGAAAAFLLCLRLWSVIGEDGAYEALAGMVAVDRFAVLARVSILVACSLSLLVSEGYARREGFDRPEYVALLLLSSSGMLLMTSANDLVMVFLALEVLSIALYVLSAFDRRRRESEEAGIKYFVLGAFSSAVLLYGIALVYGATGTTSLPGIASFLARTVVLQDGLLLAGLALLFVGLGFKVAVVPFHTWTPDVYQGAPSPVTGFMAAGAKAAGFAALIRVLVGAFEAYRLDWQLPVQVIAVATLLVGSVLAVVQEDVKRMLAYSSISHAGYVLIGVVVAGGEGIAAALFYLLSYAFLVIGSFAVVSVVAGRGDARHRLSDYRGLGKRRPALAAALTLFLLAQAGVPLTSGFVAKFAVFAAAIERGQYLLALAGVLSAVVAAFFYLRLVVVMYGESEGGEDTVPSGDEIVAEAPAAALLGSVRLAKGTDTGAAASLPVAGSAEPAVGAAAVTFDGGVFAGAAVEEDEPADRATVVAVGLSVAATLALGIFPAPLLDLAHQAKLLVG